MKTEVVSEVNHILEVLNMKEFMDIRRQLKMWMIPNAHLFLKIIKISQWSLSGN
jgi:hypothetical protein